jgi:type VI secretion system protein ImpL
MRETWWVGVIVVVLSVVVAVVLPGVPMFGGEPFTPLVIRLAVITMLFCLWGIAMVIAHARMEPEEEPPALSAEDEAREQSLIRAEEQRSSMALRFERRMEVLAQHLPGRRSGHYAYHLPWFLILGPEGAGKTTLLTRSEQDFPLSHQLETDPLAAVTPTRDMPTWVTNDAVYIDTPGGIFSDIEEGGGETDRLWNSMIGILRKYRDRRPVNGVVLVLSLEDLLLRSEYERAREARTVRHRLIDLTDRLGTRFPIHVVFSKADMLAGFVEFFDDLRRYERGQIWGMSFDLPDDRHMTDGEWRQVFQESYAALTNRRCMVQGFPQRFGGIRTIIADTLSQIFVVDRYTTPPMLRGVYFTSALQVGVPYDPMMGAISLSFDVEPRPLSAHRSGPPFFLARLFEDVVVPEAGLATDNRRVETRKAWVHRLGYAAVALSTLGLGGLWWHGYGETTRALRQAMDQLDTYGLFASSPNTSLVAATPALNALNAMRERFDQETSSPLLASVTFAPDPEIGTMARGAYAMSLRTDFASRLANQIADQLRQAVAAENGQAILDSLRAYLMLLYPERRDDAVIRSHVGALWDGTRSYAKVKDDLSTHLAAWLALRPQDAASTPDLVLVAQARRFLSTIPRAKRVYDRLKADGLTRLVGTVEVERESGALFPVVFQSRRTETADGRIDGAVPRLFTEEGWRTYFDPRAISLSQEALGESWILGDIGEGSLEDEEFRSFQREIGEYYMRDYVTEWKSLLDSLDVIAVHDLPEATRLLEAMSSPTSPLREVLKLVSRNTHLRLPEPQAESLEAGADALDALAKANTPAKQAAKGAEKALALVPEGALAGAPPPVPGHRETVTIVESYFAALDETLEGEGGATYYDSVLGALNDLYSHTREISESVDPAARALQVVKARAQGRSDDPINRLRLLATSAPPPLRGWLDSVATQTWGAILQTGQEYLNDQWYTQVYSVWRDKIAGRYPIDRSSDRDIALSDLGEFLGPSGVLDRFFQSELMAFIDPNTLTPLVIDGKSMDLDPGALRQFHHARAIRRALFTADGGLPSVDFNLKPNQLDPTVARAILTVDGQTMDYRHGPTRIARMVWPNPGGPGQSELRFQEVGAVGRVRRLDTQGPWAWFRLLDTARIEKVDGHMRITFTVSERDVSYDLWVDRQENPFLLPTLHALDLPPAL